MGEDVGVSGKRTSFVTFLLVAQIFGAAAAASRALGLNEDQTTHALGYAATRKYLTWILAFVVWWFIPNIENHAGLFKLVCLAVFLGGEFVEVRRGTVHAGRRRPCRFSRDCRRA